MALKKFTILVYIVASNFILYGQQNNDSTKCILSSDVFENREVYKYVDSMPQYPGGHDSLLSFIFMNIQLPKETIGEIFGKVITQFIVDTNGIIVDQKILRGFSEGANKAVLNVLGKMPIWSPGKCEGEIVPVVFILPINISLQ